MKKKRIYEKNQKTPTEKSKTYMEICSNLNGYDFSVSESASSQRRYRSFTAASLQ